MKILLSLTAIFMLFFCHALLADVITEKLIERRPAGYMNRETIEITEVKPDYYKVVVNYWFEGDINKFFPLAFPETERVQLIDFSATAGELPLKVEKLVAPGNGSFRFRGQRFPVLYRLSAPGKVPVKDRETHSSNLYFFKAPKYSTKGNPTQFKLIEYVLLTGGGWSGGTIGDLTISVSFLSDRCRCAQPLNNFSTGRCVTPRSMRLHVRDWKPDQNYELAVSECK
ncbi:MAG: hypothetical protein U1F16_06740 [Turneriella sp.]